MACNNDNLIAIAHAIVTILWKHVPLGTWDVVLDEILEAIVSATGIIF